MTETDDRNALHRTRMIEAQLQQTIDHLRGDIREIDEPRARAMFETSAEVLAGLLKAFHDYDARNEPGWR